MTFKERHLMRMLSPRLRERVSALVNAPLIRQVTGYNRHVGTQQAGRQAGT
jgi:hypothetical protein